MKKQSQNKPNQTRSEFIPKGAEIPTGELLGILKPGTNLKWLYSLFLSLTFASFIQQYRTGTRKMLTTATSIPPNEGIAIGTIMSEPRPVEVKTGISARIVVALVISAGLTLRIAAVTVA